MTFYPEALKLVEEFQEVEDKRERLEMLFELADEIVDCPGGGQRNPCARMSVRGSRPRLH